MLIMKIYFKLFLLLTCNFIIAQELPVLTTTSLANQDDEFEHADNGNYAIDTNNERNQYVGTWQYSQNNIVFQLKIEKVDKVLNKIEYQGKVSNYNYCDKIVLRYKLIKNGITLFNNLNEPTIDYVTSSGIKQANRDLYGRILDHTRNVVGSYTIKKNTGQPNKIIFNLILGNYRLLNDRSYYNDNQPLFSIPIKGIEMVKIN